MRVRPLWKSRDAGREGARWRGSDLARRRTSAGRSGRRIVLGRRKVGRRVLARKRAFPGGKRPVEK